MLETIVITHYCYSSCPRQGGDTSVHEANSHHPSPHLALFSQPATPCKPQQPHANKKKQRVKLQHDMLAQMRVNTVNKVWFSATDLHGSISLHIQFGNTVQDKEVVQMSRLHPFFFLFFCFYCLSSMTTTQMRQNNEQVGESGRKDRPCLLVGNEGK